MFSAASLHTAEVQMRTVALEEHCANPGFLDGPGREVGIDRIMFSADFPYASMAKARAFLDGLPLSSGDKAKIAYRNAERLLGLQTMAER
jgi:predicted TIM-barrel fold metal-dependent hydrolase